MHTTIIMPLLVALAPLALSQVIVPTAASDTFPGCAVACAVLMQAQSQCIPPAVVQSTQLSYENCFCQSAELQALYTTPDALCTVECPAESDRQLVQQWFTGFCKQVGQGIDPISTAASSAAPSTTMSTSTVSSATIQPTTFTGLPPDSSLTDSTQTGSAWLSTHWKWIVMLAVLAVAFTALALFAIWWKKRHQRKVDAKGGSRSGLPGAKEKSVDKARAATPELWGPHQHMHASQGYQYPYDGVPSVVVSKPSKSEMPEFEDGTHAQVSESWLTCSRISAGPSAYTKR